MTKLEYLSNLTSPTPSLTLKRWPHGNIVQGWSEHPELYHTLYSAPTAVDRALAGHQGTDIQGPRRSPVHAIQSGTVAALNTDRAQLGGICIWLHSPTLIDGADTVIIQTCYAHLDESLVKLGDAVERGQLIGYMGNTGCLEGTVQPYWGNAPALDNTHLHIGADEYGLRDGTWTIRYPGPTHGSFDIMTYLNGDLADELGFLARAKSYLLSLLKGR